MDPLSILQITLLLRCKQVISIVDLVYVDLTQLFHIFEHLVGECDTLARVFERLRMILVLTEDGTKLELEFALMVDSAITLRNSLVLVEIGVTDDLNALFKVEDAFLKGVKLLIAHGHVIVGNERDISVSGASL